MKLSHKLIMVSAAALMGVSPLLGAAQSVNPVAQAASKSSSKKGTITLSNNAYVYHKNGKRDTNYAGGGKNAVIAKNRTLKYVGKPITINGNEYYPIGGNDYVKAANVGYKDGKGVTPSTSKIIIITSYGSFRTSQYLSLWLSRKYLSNSSLRQTNYISRYIRSVMPFISR